MGEITRIVHVELIDANDSVVGRTNYKLRQQVDAPGAEPRDDRSLGMMIADQVAQFVYDNVSKGMSFTVRFDGERSGDSDVRYQPTSRERVRAKRHAGFLG